MVQFNYIPNTELEKYAPRVEMTRDIDHDHITVVISDFRNFLKAIGFQKGSIDKYIEDVDPNYDSDSSYEDKVQYELDLCGE